MPCSKRWGENKHTQKVTEYAGKASDAVQEIRENRRQALSNKEEQMKEITKAGMNELYHQPFTISGTITETQDIDINISPTVRWREAKIKGDFSCPDCGQMMIVIPTPGVAYAFCPKCMRYFVEAKGV